MERVVGLAWSSLISEDGGLEKGLLTGSVNARLL